MNTSEKPTIFLTGANGFLGQYLAKSFSESGFKVVGLVQNTNAVNLKWGIDEVRFFSLGKPIDPALFKREDDTDAVLVHCAWFAPWNALKQKQVLRPIQSFVTNVEGTESLYEDAFHSGVKQILFIGSLAAHEDTESIYGQHKWAVEKTTLQMGGAVLKPGVIIGPHEAANFLKYRRLVKRLPVLPVFFPRSAPLQTVWVEEVGDLAVAIVEGNHWGKSFIAGEPNGVLFSDFYRGISELENHPCKIIPVLPPLGNWILSAVRWLERLPDSRFWKRVGRWSSVFLPIVRAILLKNPIPSDSLAGLKHLKWYDTKPTERELLKGKSCRDFSESLLTIAKLEKNPDAERRLLSWARK